MDKNIRLRGKMPVDKKKQFRDAERSGKPIRVPMDTFDSLNFDSFERYRKYMTRMGCHSGMLRLLYQMKGQVIHSPAIRRKA